MGEVREEEEEEEEAARAADYDDFTYWHQRQSVAKRSPNGFPNFERFLRPTGQAP